MQNLILVPADQENLNDTIKTIVSFSQVNNILPTAISDKLRERVNNDDGFYCWAIQRGGKQRIFEQMNDDIVIFKPNGQPSGEGNYQYFKYIGCACGCISVLKLMINTACIYQYDWK